jgi:hypothetical protein
MRPLMEVDGARPQPRGLVTLLRMAAPDPYNGYAPCSGGLYYYYLQNDTVCCVQWNVVTYHAACWLEAATSAIHLIPLPTLYSVLRVASQHESGRLTIYQHQVSWKRDQLPSEMAEYLEVLRSSKCATCTVLGV